MKTAISIYLLTAVTVIAADLPSPHELFQRHFDAVGGQPSITNIETVSIEGLIVREGVTNEFTLKSQIKGWIPWQKIIAQY